MTKVVFFKEVMRYKIDDLEKVTDPKDQDKCCKRMRVGYKNSP